MSDTLDRKILEFLDRADFMTLCTSVGSNASGANVYFANDGFDLYFFTFKPSRKAQQIGVNPRVQCVVRPDGAEGIRELQIDGRAQCVRDPQELDKARRLILSVTSAFKIYMDDQFLLDNDVVGFYKIKPLTIKHVDFHASPQFEWREFPENARPALEAAILSAVATGRLYLRAVRAPFFTATLIPVLLGASVACFQLGTLSWALLGWTLLGTLLAHAGTNVANDYCDHLTRNDERNRFFSPFNGGSRMIQAGLMQPEKLLTLATLLFVGAVAVGLHINRLLHGSLFSPGPVLWAGLIGIALGIFYTAGPRLSYRGWGDAAVMLGFGPVTVLGAHYVQTRALIPELPWDFGPALLASVPVALLVGLILFINGFQDFEADRDSGKRTWVVRTADNPTQTDYRKPFRIYTGVLCIAFAAVLVLGGLGLLAPRQSTPWVWLAMLPAVLAYIGVRKGWSWLQRWESAAADRNRLPYELLPVNAITVGVHFLVGVLLTGGFLLGRY